MGRGRGRLRLHRGHLPGPPGPAPGADHRGRGPRRDRGADRAGRRRWLLARAADRARVTLAHGRVTEITRDAALRWHLAPPAAEDDGIGWLLHHAAERAPAGLAREGGGELITGPHLRLLLALLLEHDTSWQPGLFLPARQAPGPGETVYTRQGMTGAVREVTSYGDPYGDIFPELTADLLRLPLQVISADRKYDQAYQQDAGPPHTLLLVNDHYLAAIPHPAALAVTPAPRAAPEAADPGGAALGAPGDAAEPVRAGQAGLGAPGDAAEPGQAAEAPGEPGESAVAAVVAADVAQDQVVAWRGLRVVPGAGGGGVLDALLVSAPEAFGVIVEPGRLRAALAAGGGEADGDGVAVAEAAAGVFGLRVEFVGEGGAVSVAGGGERVVTVVRRAGLWHGTAPAEEGAGLAWALRHERAAWLAGDGAALAAARRVTGQVLASAGGRGRVSCGVTWLRRWGTGGSTGTWRCRWMLRRAGPARR